MIHSLREQAHTDARTKLRQRIQTAALACFSKLGLAGATMAEIAHAAGVSPGALYLYFANKKALFMSLNRPDLDQPAARVCKRRAQILAAALRIFSEKGYVAATMEEIAAAVGLSKAALYGYFASKEELFVGVLRDPQMVDALETLWGCRAAPLRTKAVASETLDEYLLRFVKVYMHAHGDREHVELMRFMLVQATRDVAVSSWMTERMGKQTAIELAQQLEGFGFGDAKSMFVPAQVFFGMLFAWASTQRVLAQSSKPPHARSLDAKTPARLSARDTAAAEAMVHIFVRGISGYRTTNNTSGRGRKRKS